MVYSIVDFIFPISKLALPGVLISFDRSQELIKKERKMASAYYIPLVNEDIETYTALHIYMPFEI